MLIRECRAEDVQLLENVAPTGANRWHEVIFERQMEGLATYLVAWYEGSPVGHCEIRWDGCESPHVRAVHPDCPELNNLVVFRQDMRRKGIGTRMIHAASTKAKERGCRRLGLGVEETNVSAAQWYERLGFAVGETYTAQWEYRDDDGEKHQARATFTFMVKDLA